MSKATSTLCAALLAFACAAATPAHAITFATGQGTDSATCGAVATPCRTLQQAVTNAPGGGYVVLKGPADFGPAPPIDKSLSIVGEGGATLRAISGGDGPFPIAAVGPASIVVRLRGLTIEGAGVGGMGVSWLGGARMEIANCVIRDFSSQGIFVQPYLPIGSTYRSSVSVIDTVIENSSVALDVRKPFQPFPYFANIGISAFVDGLRARHNRRSGVSLSYEGGDAGRAVVVNSAATGNSQGVGFSALTNSPLGPPAPGSGLIVVNSIASGNAAGVRSGPAFPSDQPDGALSLRRTVITGNAAANDGGKLAYSFGGNVIRGNTDDTLARFSLQTLH